MSKYNKGEEFYKERLTFGQNCRRFRELHYISRMTVANDTGFAYETVAKFEAGGTNNAIIYNWYLEHGYNPNTNYEEVQKSVVKKYGI